MSFDNTGAILEGIRVSTGNNVFGFPPRSLVQTADTATFNAITKRAEYDILVDSASSSKDDFDIADPDLIFRWTRNESTVIRFDYDGYGRRWMPSPGGPPDLLGPMSNTSRLRMPVPDPSVTSAPFSIYL